MPKLKHHIDLTLTKLIIIDFINLKKSVFFIYIFLHIFSIFIHGNIFILISANFEYSKISWISIYYYYYYS